MSLNRLGHSSPHAAAASRSRHRGAGDDSRSERSYRNETHRCCTARTHSRIARLDETFHQTRGGLRAVTLRGSRRGGAVSAHRYNTRRTRVDVREDTPTAGAFTKLRVGTLLGSSWAPSTNPGHVAGGSRGRGKYTSAKLGRVGFRAFSVPGVPVRGEVLARTYPESKFRSRIRVGRWIRRDRGCRGGRGGRSRPGRERRRRTPRASGTRSAGPPGLSPSDTPCASSQRSAVSATSAGEDRSEEGRRPEGWDASRSRRQIRPPSIAGPLGAFGSRGPTGTAGGG